MSYSRYRRIYAWLLSFYLQSFRDRFAEGMEQTFNDLLQERRQSGKRLFALVLRLWFDAVFGIARENLTAMRADLRKLVMPFLIVAGATAVLTGIYFANGADDPWYYVTAWVIVLSSCVPYSTSKGK